MLPEMFCSANDCACIPDTAVVNALKIPMTLPLQLDPERHELGPRRMAQRRAAPSNRRAMKFIVIYQYLMDETWFWPGPDMPTTRQILPRRHELRVMQRRPPRCLVSDKFAVF